MPKPQEKLKNGVRAIYAEFFTKNLPMFVLSLVIFAGGVALLALRIPGWSLVLGLPAVQAGIVFLIFTFDKLVQSRVESSQYTIVPCEICGRPILASSWKEKDICLECQKKLIEESKKSTSSRSSTSPHPDHR